MGEASEISQAVAAVAALDEGRRRAMYGRAVAFGVGNTHCSSERERQFGALRLLALATLRLPDVALYDELLHSYAGDPRACCLVAQTLIGASSGAMRLAHRALEMHAVAPPQHPGNPHANVHANLTRRSPRDAWPRAGALTDVHPLRAPVRALLPEGLGRAQ